MGTTRRGWLKLGKVAGTLAVCIISVVAATTALAATRDQRWIDVASGFNSQTWYSTAKGNHGFTRYTCSTNYPTPPNTTFTLYHQRGGLPDENKGVLISSTPCSTAERVSGTGRTTYPG